MGSRTLANLITIAIGETTWSNGFSMNQGRCGGWLAGTRQHRWPEIGKTEINLAVNGAGHPPLENEYRDRAEAR